MSAFDEQSAASKKRHTDAIYQRGFDAGYKAAKDEVASNYDAWKRANESSSTLGTSIGSIADLAVRQVIYGNPTGKAPHETEPKEKA